MQIKLVLIILAAIAGESFMVTAGLFKIKSLWQGLLRQKD
jgi:hypothetical protein